MSIPVLVIEQQAEISACAHFSLQDESAFVLVGSPEGCNEIASVSRRLGSAILLAGPEFVEALDQNEAEDLFLLDTLQVLLVTGDNADEPTILNYIRLGCRGVLRLADSANVWRNAVRSVAAGELWLSRKATASLVRDFLRSARKSVTPKLTPREVEILNLLRSGHSNRAIAEQLFITKDTVRWHLRTLYAKLGVSDRATAIKNAGAVLPGPASPSAKGKARSAENAG